MVSLSIYSNDIKKKSRQIVLGIGIFAIVMGCITAFLGNQKSGGGKID